MVALVVDRGRALSEPVPAPSSSLLITAIIIRSRVIPLLIRSSSLFITAISRIVLRSATTCFSSSTTSSPLSRASSAAAHHSHSACPSATPHASTPYHGFRTTR